MRTVFFAALCALLAGLCTSAPAAAHDRNLILTQWPGPPGPPPGVPGQPGWPGPSPGPEWLAHEQQCEGLTRHLEAIRHRIHRSPPWVRPQLAAQAMATEDRLRRECWGP